MIDNYATQVNSISINFLTNRDRISTTRLDSFRNYTQHRVTFLISHLILCIYCSDNLKVCDVWSVVIFLFFRLGSRDIYFLNVSNCLTVQVAAKKESYTSFLSTLCIEETGIY